jgi:hypothetical protein
MGEDVKGKAGRRLHTVEITLSLPAAEVEAIEWAAGRNGMSIRVYMQDVIAVEAVRIRQTRKG